MSKTKSQIRREIIQKPAEEKKDKDEVILTATENTFLADGRFIAKGEKVAVPKEYAERVKKENNKSLK